MINRYKITPEIEKYYKKKYGKLYDLAMETMRKFGLPETPIVLYNIIQAHKYIKDAKERGEEIDHDRVREIGELIHEFRLRELTEIERGRRPYFRLPLSGRNIRFLTKKSIEHGKYGKDVLAESLRWYLKIPDIPREKLGEVIDANARRIKMKQKIREKLRAKEISVEKARKMIKNVERKFHKTLGKIIKKEVKLRELKFP